MRVVKNAKADFIPLGNVAACQYGLSEPADPNGERLYIGMGQLQNGKVVLDGANRLSVSATIGEKFGLQIGDVLFNRTNSQDLVGKTALVEDHRLVGSVFASYLVRLQVDGTRYDSRFLNMWMNTADSCSRLRRLATPGVSQYNIRPSLLLDKFQVPAWPLAKQRSTADIIEQVEKLLALVDGQLKLKIELKRGVAKRLLSGQVRFPQFKGLPWVDRALGAVFEECARPVDWDDEAVYTLVSVRRRSGGVFLRERRKGSDIKVKAQFETREGDILISTRQVVHGAIALVPKEFNGAHVSGEYMVLVPRACSTIVPKYFEQLCRLPAMRHIAYLSSYGVDIEKLTFNPRWYLASKVKLPPTTEEQERIAEVLSLMDREIQLIEAQKEGIVHFRDAIFGLLLSGAIKVPG